MDIKNFLEEVDIIINSPINIKEKSTSFLEDCINVSEFPIELRPVNWSLGNVESEKDGDDYFYTLTFNWVANGWNDDLDDLVKEVERYFTYLARRAKIEGCFNIKLHVWHNTNDFRKDICIFL